EATEPADEELAEEEAEEVEVTPSKIAMLEQLVDITRKWERVIAGEESVESLKSAVGIPVVTKTVKKKKAKKKKAAASRKGKKVESKKKKARTKRKGKKGESSS
ncbi:MAG: hypothetical protein ACP5HP_03880, partial [Thermogladius sp.]